VIRESSGHWAQECQRLVVIAERIGKVKKAHRCLLCLKGGHTSSNYGKKGEVECTRSSRPHNQSLCDEGKNTTIVVDQSNITAVEGR